MAAPGASNETHRAFIARLADALRPIDDPMAVETEATRLLGEHLSVNRATYSEIDGEWLVMRGRYADGVAAMPDRAPLAAFGEPLLADCRAGAFIAIADVRQDARTAGVCAAFEALEVRAVMGATLVKGGRWVASLSVDSAVPRAWSPAEGDLVREVAERTWAAAERARAEAALRENEARHRHLFEMLDDGVTVAELVRDAAGAVTDWRYLFANAALERQSGLSPAAVTGRLGSDVLDADYTTWLPIIAAAVESQRPLRLERDIPSLGRVLSVQICPYGRDRVALLYHDVTARTRDAAAMEVSRARQEYRLRLADALRPLRDARAIPYEAACVLGDHLGATRAYYAEIDVEAGTIDVARNWTRSGVASVAGRHPFAAFAWIGPAFAAGSVVAENDVLASALVPEAFRPALAAIDVGAFIVAPLVKDGRLVATLSVIAGAPRTWTPEEVQLVEETAERTWASVERARAEVALQAVNDDLERRVRERTAQLAATNAALEHEVHVRRTAERQSRSLFQQLITAQEEERRRISRDVHDQVGQQITALRMHLDALHAGVASHDAMRDAIARIQRLAEDLDGSIDFLTWELRPSTLDHLGLAAALGDLVRRWGERFGIDAEFACAAADLRLVPEVETNLYWLVQEALHNVVKHARAQHVAVVLSRHDGHARLAIEDDGCGFDPVSLGQAEEDRGVGLIGMRERATLMGGELEIDAQPGRGTAIFVRVPIARGA